jgi:hypothetical protein
MGIVIGFITIFCILTVVVLLCIRSEYKTWNKGVCRKNGLPWVFQDQDSQGGRLYRAGEEITWISWPVDKAIKQQLCCLERFNVKKNRNDEDVSSLFLFIDDHEIIKKEDLLKILNYTDHKSDCSYKYDCNQCNCGYKKILSILNETRPLNSIALKEKIKELLKKEKGENIKKWQKWFAEKENKVLSN